MKEVTPGEIVARLKQTEEAIQAAQDNVTDLSSLLKRFADENKVSLHDSAKCRAHMGEAHGAVGQALLEVIHAHRELAIIAGKMGVPMPRTGGGGK